MLVLSDHPKRLSGAMTLIYQDRLIIVQFTSNSLVYQELKLMKVTYKCGKGTRF